MKTIPLTELLKTMSTATYRTLKARGKILLAQSAPHAEVILASVPLRYRQALASAHPHDA